jgi:hypothetical protein
MQGVIAFLGRLAQYPFKRVAALVIAFIVIGEFYPFSHFPMYSGVSSDADYFYITNESDEPIPMVQYFGTRTAQAKKIYRKQLTELTDARKVKRAMATREEERQAGEYLLNYLLKTMPDPQRPLLKASEIRLIRVALTIEDAKFKHEKHTIASIDPGSYLVTP